MNKENTYSLIVLVSHNFPSWKDGFV